MPARTLRTIALLRASLRQQSRDPRCPSAPHASSHRRTFLSLPDLSAILPEPPKSLMRKEYTESKVLQYPPAVLYDLVRDVDSYRYFLPFCQHSRVFSTSVLEPGHQLMRAELGVGFGGFEERYMSEVNCWDGWKVEAKSADTNLFKHMLCSWVFSPLHTSSKLPTHRNTNSHSHSHLIRRPTSADHLSLKLSPTLVDFLIEFEFRNPAHAAAASLAFSEVAGRVMAAFEARCKDVIGKSGNTVGLGVKR
ncbi:hypothetical protein M427DRAFT_52164 [Gonapodya prolifera JEL478]|uniref:Coenzyme Q-binding protein COQ10 START domain-containing protein n=1 Tax=Gonapodya prolifera (strain JEL478) TaxID=1344416 RepID=A0A139AV37_GONPJ|nr:hypothetical protein M427DRAFT_52164 [Gonapodya prolifera JEL478]|eukprot:KXS20564.1 hypothetical protein M427DRAFT_52164 [Gonapodya prolifera JEL478]